MVRSQARSPDLLADARQPRSLRCCVGWCARKLAHPTIVPASSAPGLRSKEDSGHAPCAHPLGRPRRYREGLGPRERAVLWSWTGFTTTFGAVRAITYTTRRGGGPFRNVSVGGVHLHHYLWGHRPARRRGRGRRARHRTRPGATRSSGWPTAPGMALIVDEFALLLDLKDVYWERQGRGVGRHRRRAGRPRAARRSAPSRCCAGCTATARGSHDADVTSQGFDAPAAGPLASPPCRRPRSSYFPGASRLSEPSVVDAPPSFRPPAVGGFFMFGSRERAARRSPR
jgi:hypothetical protein